MYAPEFTPCVVAHLQFVSAACHIATKQSGEAVAFGQGTAQGKVE